MCHYRAVSGRRVGHELVVEAGYYDEIRGRLLGLLIRAEPSLPDSGRCFVY
jgi:hypothetical protein